MKTLRLNVASVTKSLSASDLERFARDAGPVPVYSTAHEARAIGRTLGYEWSPPDDLWALSELEDDAAEFYAASRAHCEAVITFVPEEGIRLVAVVMTNYKMALERVLANRTPR